MATEKILIFDEAGNAKRMKVRIARFLDNEPVTDSDKENIRTTLNVDGSQSGTFTTPLSVTSASDSSFSGGGNVTVSGGVTTLNNSGDNALRVESTNGNAMYVNVVGSAQNYIFDVRDDGTSKFRIDGSGRVGIGGSPAYELDVQGGNARIAATSDAGVVNHLQADNTGAYVGPLSNHNLFFKQNNITRWAINTTGNLVASSGVGIDFGSGASTTLDDYEFGTFTVTTNSDATGAITSSLGEYTKIGRLVNVRIVFEVSTNFTTNKIAGLPFTVNSLGTGASAVSSPSVVLNSSGTDSPVTCHTVRGNTTVAFSAGTSVGVDHNPNTTNLTYRLQFSYHTDD